MRKLIAMVIICLIIPITAIANGPKKENVGPNKDPSSFSVNARRVLCEVGLIPVVFCGKPRVRMK